MEKKITLPAHVESSLAVLRQAGHTAYAVGGCVRDLLLDRTPHDWDVTTSARPEQILALFPGSVLTGGEYGTVTVSADGGSVQVTPFRIELDYFDGRHPHTVVFGVSLEDDLARRDLTINAMALDENGQVIDLYGGLDDMEHRLIRTVGNPNRRYAEDALRMYRTVRISAQLGFILNRDVHRALLRCAPLFRQVPTERIWAETELTLMSPRPSTAGLFFTLGLMPVLRPPRLDGTELLDQLPPELFLRWAALCGCLLRGYVIRDCNSLLTALDADGRTLRACTGGEALWRAGLPQTDAQWRRALAQHGADVCRAAAVMEGAEPLAQLTAVLDSSPCLTAHQLALSGADLAALGLSGPDIGAAQARLLDHVLDHPEDNSPSRLRELLN